MTELKCPFCNEPLVITNKNLVSCQNLHCEIGNLPMPLIVVKETIRTKKQLDVAVDALQRIADAPIGYCMFAEEALKQIKEQQ